MDNETIYKNRFPGKEVLEDKNKVWKVICQFFLQQYVEKDSLTVDVAAGYCEFINNIESREKIAFDINPDLKLYASKDVLTVNDSFFELSNYLKNKKADVVFASNIFEHLDNKEQVIQAIKLFYDNLKYGGRLIILQPNIKYVKEEYWDFIDHKVALTDKSLIEA